jgi:hypothetical protein
MAIREDQLLDPETFNSVETIMAVTDPSIEEECSTVVNNADTLFTWDYTKGARPRLEKLYEKAKTSQWNGETDLDWSIEVDVEKTTADLGAADANFTGPIARLAEEPGNPFAHFGDDEWQQLRIESQGWRLSQFLHGEQGALVCTAKIVETVPWIDAKYYASTQVMDEARHVEVFAKYLNEKWPSQYPVNVHLKTLLDDIIADSRWDMTYLGMQIMVEGLALAAFGFTAQITNEPLLKKLLRYVMADEARHVAFGVLSLQEYYDGLTNDEILDRQVFAFEAALRMRDRLMQQEVFERMGVDSRPVIQALLDASPDEKMFQRLLFSKIVPNCKKLGLLDAGDGWLRDRFTDIGVIEFEDLPSTDDEYGALDEVEKDRVDVG